MQHSSFASTPSDQIRYLIKQGSAERAWPMVPTEVSMQVSSFEKFLAVFDTWNCQRKCRRSNYVIRRYTLLLSPPNPYSSVKRSTGPSASAWNQAFLAWYETDISSNTFNDTSFICYVLIQSYYFAIEVRNASAYPSKYMNSSTLQTCELSITDTRRDVLAKENLPLGILDSEQVLWAPHREFEQHEWKALVSARRPISDGMKQ